MRKALAFSGLISSLIIVVLFVLPVAGLGQSAGDLYSTDSIVGKMRYVPAGVFTQGSPVTEPGRKPDENQFSHFLTKNIAVMETAVTRQMWADLLAAQPWLPADPSWSVGSDIPAQRLTWYEAVLFANLLSIQNGLMPCYYKDSRFTVLVNPANYTTGSFYCNFDASGYRLPLEAEREYFTRAGTTGIFSIHESNSSDSTLLSCAPGALPALESVSWFCANNTTYGMKTAGSKAANPWNLKDVHGNVMEWCWDLYGPYPASDATDFRGAASGGLRVIRGGAWPFDARVARSASRFSRVPYFPNDTSIGFRLVRTVGAAPASSIAVISPAGGESWWAGTVQPLTWTATDDIDYIDVEYSTSDGTHWTTIASSVPNSGSYSWSVPGTPSSSCRVRLKNSANPATYDICGARFEITPVPPPAIGLNRIAAQFFAASGQASLPPQGVTIGNSAGGTLNWSASPSAGWLTVTPASGSGGGQIQVEANLSGLAPGTYNATIEISDPQASNSPQTIAVYLDISSNSERPYFTVEKYLFHKPPQRGFIDFDNDGDEDVVYAEGFPPFCAEPWANACLHALRNDGQGNFTEVTSEIFSQDSNIVVCPGMLIAADLNGDGREDLFVSDSPYDTNPYGGGQSLIFIQTADGRLVNETGSRLPAGIGAGALAGDIDGDGDLDIVGLLQVGLPPYKYAFLFINDGAGRFSLSPDGLPDSIANGPKAYICCALLDADSDGDLDLFMGAHPGNLEPRDTILLNDGTGHFSFAPASTLPPRLFEPRSAEDTGCDSADFNADGWPDVVAYVSDPVTGQAALQLMLNNGDGTFRDASSGIPTPVSTHWMVQTGDVNNDGWMDILYAPVSIYMNQGDETFLEARNSLLPCPPADYYGFNYIAADIDGDGDTDLLSDTACFFRNIRPYVTATPLPYPAAPVLVSPADGITLGTNAPTLTWSPVATAVTYEVEVATDAGFSYLVFARQNIGPTFYRVTGLDNNATYYWRARAFNTRGAGPWSGVRSFSVSPVTIVSPNGGENWPGGTTRSITWTAKGMTGTLTIDLYKGGVFNSNIGQANVGSGTYSWSIPSGLAEGADYRVKIHQGAVSDMSDADFLSYKDRIISGHVLAYGQPVRQVVLGGLPGNPETDAAGFYSVSVPYGWSGTVTPFCFTCGYLFNPESVKYTKVAGDQVADYEAFKGIPQGERAILIALYNSTHGDSWGDRTGWKTPPLEADGFGAYGTEGGWSGVTVNNHRVTELHATAYWIPSTPIPPELGGLTHLTTLQLTTGFTGQIPPELGNLRELNVLTIMINALTGPIPGSFANLNKLQWLALGDNQLSGNIPSFLGSLNNLTALALWHNQFSGSIPPELGNLTGLAQLLLDCNNLSGEVPASLTNLVNITPGCLSLEYNALRVSDPALAAFLAVKGRTGWDTTQTVAPANVTAVAAGPTAAIVSWAPIVYTSNGGGYRVLYGRNSGGPYTLFGQTASKMDSSLQVNGLQPGTKYFFVVQTHTDPVGCGLYPNTVDSEYSAEVSATTPGLTPTVDDLVVDFGPVGLWLWSAGVWSSITGVNPDGMIAADVDGDNKEEIVVDFGAVGLWIWDDGAWTQLSGVNADGMIAADADGDGKAEVVGDFGSTGLWLWNEGSWTQLSGINADGMIRTNKDADLADEIVVDFGTVGLWISDGGSWTQISGVNADGMLAAKADSDSEDEAVVDFGAVGLWLWDSGGWSQLSGVNADGMTAGDLDGDSQDELAVDFGSLGLWVCDSGSWSQVSGVNAESLFVANVTTSASSELIADFGSLGIWMRDSGTWSQVSPSNPDAMISANLDADAVLELVVDFGALGIHVWNGGAWSQLSASNPDSMIARKR